MIIEMLETLDQAIPSGLARLKGRQSPAIGRLFAFHIDSILAAVLALCGGNFPIILLSTRLLFVLTAITACGVNRFMLRFLSMVMV
jgi:hypothetical protein